jgi:hypothetical protein
LIDEKRVSSSSATSDDLSSKDILIFSRDDRSRPVAAAGEYRTAGHMVKKAVVNTRRRQFLPAAKIASKCESAYENRVLKMC